MKQSSSSSSSEQQYKYTNRLVKESSPYLLQHAHNPVDWYPWGEEAFEKARNENKPIFLSIGYSTCHWCHVMEKESFENEEIAAIMNQHFVNIKVDREERPDIDRVYMTFVQLTTGSGGWPLSCFLTPQLKPIFGGTYFPPVESIYRGHISFPSLLNKIHIMWNSKREALVSQGDKIVTVLKKAFTEKDNEDEPTKSADHILKFAHEYVASTVEDFLSAFDTVYGGYSSAPKFPRPVVLDFLLRSYYEEKDDRRKLDIINSVTFTLDKMARGGMYDHLGGGFHRYSVDTYWHVPHFEKMMYDQGQLAVVYAEAYKATRNEYYKQILEEILLYIERDMSLGESSEMIGFYSAEDADSLPTFDSKEKREGAFYAWDYQQVVDIVDNMVPHVGIVKPSEIFSFMFNLKQDGNVRQSSDPHGELTGLNVLHMDKSLQETQERFSSIPPESVANVIMDCKDILFKERNKMKPRPHLDDKIITSWNAYVISAFARSALLLSEPGYLKIAERAATLIYEKLYDRDTKVLHRIFKKNSEKERNIDGFLSDYANMISALIDLYESSGSIKWLNWAFELQDIQDSYFYDDLNGGYFEERGNDPTIIYRMKETSDSAEPSGNSVSCMNLVRLRNYDVNKKAEYEEKISKILQWNAGLILEHPSAVPGLMSALARLTSGRETHIALVFDKTVTNLKPIMEEIVKDTVESHRSLVFVNKDDEESLKFMNERLPYLNDAKVLNNQTTIILCRNNTCNLPTNDISVIQELK